MRFFSRQIKLSVTWRIAILIFPVSFLPACHLTQSYSAGTWQSNNDTLYLHPEGSFLYVDHTGNKYVRREGKWSADQKCIALRFNEGRQPDQDSVITFCRRINQVGRRRIYRPVDSYPSNRFKVFTKVTR